MGSYDTARVVHHQQRHATGTDNTIVTTEGSNLLEIAINTCPHAQESFTSALTQIKVLEITAQIESCRK